jgi:hypothetical protein
MFGPLPHVREERDRTPGFGEPERGHRSSKAGADHHGIDMFDRLR